MRNFGINYNIVEEKKLHVCSVCNDEVEEVTSCLLNKCHKNDKEKWIETLLKSITHLDLTSLTGNETSTDITELCSKASCPIPYNTLQKFEVDPKDIRCAAVCVYPKYAANCQKVLESSLIQIAAVAGDFPAGKLPLAEKITEIKIAVNSGATEIDVVINKDFVLNGDWKALYDEIKEMKNSCGQDVHMKVIIKAGDLGSLDNVYSASFIAMAAGADFIKTSTGKEAVNATLPVGIVMCRAVKHYHRETGFKVGFKPAGGIRTAEDAFQWMTLIEQELGPEWLNQILFRIGASSLLDDIAKNISEYANVQK